MVTSAAKRAGRGARSGRPAAVFLLLATALMAAAGAAWSRPSALSHLPGYVPLVDPESTSVVLGRRTGVPIVRTPFRGGEKSLADLGRAVCRYLHHTQRDSLLSLCVSADEFRDILWREFPQSRPATGLVWEDAWKILYARHRSGCLGALSDLGGEHYEFVRFERLPRADSVVRYANFRTHNGLILVTRDGTGQLQRWNWLRSVAERKGSFKIYSTTD